MSLYLDSILRKKAGTVTLTIPDSSGNGGTNVLQGFLTENPSFSLQNNWGSIFPDFNALSEVSQLMGSQNVFSWLASTQAGWKGTEPLTISVEFYVISYSKSKNIKKEVSHLIKMGTLHTGTGLLKSETVQIHGGYANNYWQDNTSFIDSIDSSYNSLSGTKQGLIKMEVGDQMRLTNLLLSDVQTTHSAVQVAKGIPLFIKVNASFRTYRTLLDTDIDDMYDVNSNTTTPQVTQIFGNEGANFSGTSGTTGSW